MEAVLNSITSKFISLEDDKISRNNKILKSLLGELIHKMVQVDWLFRDLFQREFYGGSYYDGLKVGQPDEYDLKLLLKLPDFTKPSLIISDIDGFVYLMRQMPPETKYFNKLTNQHQLSHEFYQSHTNRPTRFKTLGRIFDRIIYLDTRKTLSWIEGVLDKALNTFPTRNGVHFFGNGDFRISFIKHGPALTLKITGEVTIDVDLVPCFVLGKENWPGKPFRPNPVPSKPDFFLVPKRPLFQGINEITWYWRLSFEEQERELLKNKQNLKLTIRLLKKMRDTMGHELMASYNIKNLFLWAIEKKDDDFWRKPLSVVFMTMLKYYQKTVESQTIDFYWNKKSNLLKPNSDAWTNISNGLKKIINDIENNIHNPTVIAKYLLNTQELAIFEG